jgi:hypothetical protein
MKTLINSPESVLEEMLKGLAVLDPGLARQENFLSCSGPMQAPCAIPRAR